MFIFKNIVTLQIDRIIRKLKKIAIRESHNINIFLWIFHLYVHNCNECIFLSINWVYN